MGQAFEVTVDKSCKSPTVPSFRLRLSVHRGDFGKSDFFHKLSLPQRL